jgi:hypothetical protein
VITLRHINTNTTLMTHDVACPTLATNTEFTTWNHVDGDNELNTHFKLQIDDAHEGQQWMTKSAHFQLFHEATKVVMWTHSDPPLGDWAYKQQEVNGNKNLKDKSTFWIVDTIVRDESESQRPLQYMRACTDAVVRRYDGRESTSPSRTRPPRQVDELLPQVLRAPDRHAPTQRGPDRLAPLRVGTHQLALPPQRHQFLDGSARG